MSHLYEQNEAGLRVVFNSPKVPLVRMLLFSLILKYIQSIYKKGCTRLVAASDKDYQLLAHGRRFSLKLKLVAMI
jgi:hypothetical protein